MALKNEEKCGYTMSFWYVAWFFSSFKFTITLARLDPDEGPLLETSNLFVSLR